MPRKYIEIHTKVFGIKHSMFLTYSHMIRKICALNALINMPTNNNVYPEYTVFIYNVISYTDTFI